MGSYALTSPRSSVSYTTSPKSFSPRAYSSYSQSSISTISSPNPSNEVRRLSEKELQEKGPKACVLGVMGSGMWDINVNERS